MIQIRNSCYETNSSSSHSVCISMDGQESWEEIQSLIYNDTLHIYPKDGYFEDIKTNKCLDKLQFLVSLICKDVSTVHGAKRVKQFRTKLKNLVSVSKVYIGHVDEYYSALRNRGGKLFENRFEYSKFLRENFKLSTINDYKRTLESEIFETPETLRSFILSPNSWLYVSESLARGAEINYYKSKSEMYCGLENDYDSIATVDYGGNGDNKVDIGINIFNPFSINSLLWNIKSTCMYIGLNDSNDGLIYKDPAYETRLEIIDDTYNLINIEEVDNNYDVDGRLVGGIIGTYRKFSEISAPIFKHQNYIVSYKNWPVQIKLLLWDNCII